MVFNIVGIVLKKKGRRLQDKKKQAKDVAGFLSGASIT